MCELVGPTVQLSKGELLLLKDDRECVWSAFDLLFEELVNALIEIVVASCVVPVKHESLSLGRTDDFQIVWQSFRMLEYGGQECLKLLRELAHERFVA